MTGLSKWPVATGNGQQKTSAVYRGANWKSSGVDRCQSRRLIRWRQLFQLDHKRDYVWAADKQLIPETDTAFWLLFKLRHSSQNSPSSPTFILFGLVVVWAWPFFFKFRCLCSMLHILSYLVLGHIFFKRAARTKLGYFISLKRTVLFSLISSSVLRDHS